MQDAQPNPRQLSPPICWLKKNRLQNSNLENKLFKQDIYHCFSGINIIKLSDLQSNILSFT
jgi:hypothetical protein